MSTASARAHRIGTFRAVSASATSTRIASERVTIMSGLSFAICSDALSADPDALDADHLTARDRLPSRTPENAKARDEAERLLGR